MARLRLLLLVIAVVLARPRAAGAQTTFRGIEIAGQIASATSGQFEATEAGVGGRVAWRPIALLGLEAELNVYPGDFPDSLAFSASRLEALFGATAGPTFGRMRPFARLRSGFVNMAAAPQSYACIAVYPPPLSCTLASGATLLAFDVGGGVEVSAGRRTFIRIDAGDRLVRYPGPADHAEGVPREESFFGHDFRFAAGAGFRF